MALKKIPSNGCPPQPKSRSYKTLLILYYPLYTGYTFPETPLHFKQPSHVLSWALSRFKKDGLGNAWVGSLPSFLRFVGVTRVDRTTLRITSFSTHRRSSLEGAFFSDVTFYDIIDPTVIPSTNYMQCSDSLYTQCLNTFKTTQDYQMSSNSTYTPNRKCIDSTSQDISFHHCPFLSGKKHSSANSFIQLEKKFKYLKENTYIDIGRWVSILFDSIFTSSNSHTQILLR